MLRKALAIGIAILAGVAIWRLVAIPWRCNNVEGRVSRSTELIWSKRDEFASRSIAQRNLDSLAACLERDRTAVNLRMLAASNLTILGRAEAAARLLEDALQYDQRPELYLALGLAQLKTGRREEALRSFVTAANFGGMQLLEDVPDGELRVRAYVIAGERREKSLVRQGKLDLRNRIRNANFARAAANVRPASPGYRGILQSAADSWLTYAPSTAPVVTSLVPSTRRSGGRAIHVETFSKDAGLRQVLPLSGAPPRARLSVSVFVRRGAVYVGAGPDPNPLGSYSKTTGQWERIDILNDGCPARVVVVNAATDGGADFYVDEVSLRETVAAPPCR
jgi:hypothetical protein